MSRKVYDRQFKMAAVQLILEENMFVKEVAKELLIHSNTLYRWISEYEEYGDSVFPGRGSALYHSQYEMKKLKRENEELRKELDLPKKVPGLLEEKECVRFQYLKENKHKYNIKKACKTLNISRSGYYEYLQRKPSKRTLENRVLSEEIQQIFEEYKGRYGSLRITKVLEKKGIEVNRKRVGKLMRQMKLYAKGSRYRYKRYNKKSPSIERPNLLNQVFQTDRRNKIWVGDITYIPTPKGTLYLAVFVDMYSRKVIGWSMSTRMKDSLVIDAFLQGYKKEHPKIGLIIHTDPYDNALMESFYKTIKRELIQGAKFKTPEHARKEIFKYIELYYNTKRMHSYLDYLSPIEFEKSYS
ncbi:IS3 family transposase [Bacillus pseudomycoides]|uniref:IS3 family transposase n=1 Tax=Bacillus pseudomycoides TaxID=64104 RepID=UPI001145DF6D|nr:IS3 family transposase [Bacillus pseudomycoides]